MGHQSIIHQFAFLTFHCDCLYIKNTNQLKNILKNEYE